MSSSRKLKILLQGCFIACCMIPTLLQSQNLITDRQKENFPKIDFVYRYFQSLLSEKVRIVYIYNDKHNVVVLLEYDDELEGSLSMKDHTMFFSSPQGREVKVTFVESGQEKVFFGLEVSEFFERHLTGVVEVEDLSFIIISDIDGPVPIGEVPCVNVSVFLKRDALDKLEIAKSKVNADDSELIKNIHWAN